ncbi:hypothetical protein ACJJTC_005711 [Scirpophaga incertulas]
MIVGGVSIMLCIVLCPVLIAAVQTLTIDSQLGTSIEDCFERYSIGERLPRDAIYRNISELTTRECEQLCKQDKQCQTYDYGVGAKGNATCNLSNISEKEFREKNLASRHPDYDIYVRRFQCEQSPPSPLQSQFDDPEEPGPLHRPVYRPEVDDSRKPLDDFVADSHSFETTRPDVAKPYRPFISLDHPYDLNQKPEFDIPPSYGDHRPQEIPYTPSYNHNYHNMPHRPGSHRPDPYDVFLLNDVGKPDPYFWRPDPYHPHVAEDISNLYGAKPIRSNKPDKDPYVLEKPHYHYIYRPNKKPNGEHNKPNYNPSHHTSAVDPANQHKPNYSYNTQYASNYGQSNNDNKVHVEIYDPPRPYTPPLKHERPYYGSHLGYGPQYGYSEGNLAYGSSYNSQNSLSQFSSYYGQGTITELNNNQGYNGPQSSQGHGQTSAHNTDNFFKPNSHQTYNPSDNKPIHQSSQSPYGNYYGNSDSGHGQYATSYNSSQLNGNLKPGYASQSDSNIGQFMQKPNNNNHRPNIGYGHDTLGHHNFNQGINIKPSYTGVTENYDSHYSSQEVGQSFGQAYGNYGMNKPYENSLYNYRPEGNNYESYQRPMKPIYDIYRPRPTYPYAKPSYYNDRPFNDNDKPTYDYNKPQIDNNRPLENYMPFYSNNKPSNNDLSNGNAKPSYGNNGPNNRPYNEIPAYGVSGITYDSNRPTHVNRPANNKPTIDVDRPDPNYGSDALADVDIGYGANKQSGYKPIQPNRTDNSYLDKPDIKPVYENEFDRPINVPSYIVRPGGEVVTSKPVVIGNYGGPSYGRHRGSISYKG